MDFGMPTLIELQGLAECIALCRGLGFSFIELNMNMPAYLPERLDEAEMREFQGEGGYFTIHLDEQFNPCDLNGRVRQAYLDTLREAVELALKYSVPVINMHMAEGIYFTLPDRRVYQYEIYKEQYIQNIIQFKALAEAYLQGTGTKLCVENTSGYHGFQREAIDLLLDSGAFGLTFDIGHNHISKRGGDEDFILARRSKLRHMHLHDAALTCHMALGTGELDLRRYLALAGETGSRCVVETKTVKALRESRRHLPA